MKKKRSTGLSQTSSGTLEKFVSRGGSLSPVPPKMKNYTLSTDLIDFNARLVGSAFTPKYDLVVYSKKSKTIVHERNVP